MIKRLPLVLFSVGILTYAFSMLYFTSDILSNETFYFLTFGGTGLWILGGRLFNAIREREKVVQNWFSQN
jgi:hypothetical protein